MSYDIPIPFKESGNFITTGVVNFTGSDLRPGLIDKAVSYAGDLSAISNPNLEYVAPSLRSLNQYGADNDLTCVWTSITDSNYSKYSPAFKLNNAQITPTVFGDATVVNKGNSDGLYAAIENRGYLDGSDNFVKNNNYLIYVKYGSPNKLIIFDFAVNLWFIETANDDPNLWTNGQATGVSGSTLISNSTETIGTLFRADSNVDLGYQPDNNEFADISNGLVSFSDNFFVGKSDFSYEANHQISSLTGSANIFWIRYSTLANFIRLHVAGNFLRLGIKDDSNLTTTLEYDLTSDPLDLKGDGTGFSKGDELNISWEYKDKGNNANGEAWLKVNGTLVDSATLADSIKANEFAAMLFDQQSNFLVKNFRFQSSLNRQGANFIPESSLPEFPFIETPVDLISGSYPEVGDIQSLVALLSAASSGVNFVINGLYYNGASWVTSDNSFSQSNDLSTISANASTFPVQPKDYTVAGVFSGGNIRSYIDDIAVQFLAQKYSEAISATHSLGIPFQEITEIQTTVVKPDSEFVTDTYVLLIGSTPYWWNKDAKGGQGDWEISDATIAMSNTIDVINANLSSLQQTGILKLTSFLGTTDEATGYQNLEAPSISLAIIKVVYQVPTLIPSPECLLYFLDRSVDTNAPVDIGDGSSEGDILHRFVVRNHKAFKNGSTMVRSGDIVSVPLGSAAVVAEDVYQLEPLRDETDPENIKYYKFEFLFTVTKTVSRQGQLVQETTEESLGFAETPAQQSFLFTDLDLSTTPGVNYPT